MSSISFDNDRDKDNDEYFRDIVSNSSDEDLSYGESHFETDDTSMEIEIDTANANTNANTTEFNENTNQIDTLTHVEADLDTNAGLQRNYIDVESNQNEWTTSSRTASSSLLLLFRKSHQNDILKDHVDLNVHDYDEHINTSTNAETITPSTDMSKNGTLDDDFHLYFEPKLERKLTEKMTNNSAKNSGTNLHSLDIASDNETDPLLSSSWNENHAVADIGNKHKQNQDSKINCFNVKNVNLDSFKATLSGSVMFILFHILFCLAQASAIHRPHSSKSVLGQMTRMAALGPIIAGPVYIYILGDQFPALYPTIDAFPAPFLVQMAVIVDDLLYSNGMEDDDDLFMTTFSVLSGLGLIFTGLFLYIGTKFQLANLGAYLPYPVLAGFFSTVGFLGWTLAFSVDTGKNIGEVITDRNWNEMKTCMIHHFPSVIAGISISLFASGPRKSWTPIFVLGTIPVVFIILCFTNTSLDDARDMGWFWKKDEFESISDSSIYSIHHHDNGNFAWKAPLPFGVVLGVLRGNIYFPAIWKGLPVSLAMGLMYLLRCSLHVPALQKNSETLFKWEEDQKQKYNKKQKEQVDSMNRMMFEEDYANEQQVLIKRTFSEESCYNNHDEDQTMETNYDSSKNKKQIHSVADCYLWYAKCLFVSGLAGGSATIPSMGASITLFKIGARGKAPQYGSIFLLVFFYMNKFELVGYFPRIVFSTLLFISSMDLLQNWFILSYNKTADKGEWLIVPILSLFAFVVGVLPAVALGLAMSTFIFVATFYRSGVVKFMATGLTIHSTTERNIDDAEWLDRNGDLIQVMVLQNYLFFGNANSVKNYVSTMFDNSEEVHNHNLTPLPKYLIIDMSLVTGIDTSAAEIFGDIVSLCYQKKCQIFLAGLTPHLKHIFNIAGINRSVDKKSKFSILFFSPRMESALMKAEDGLLKFVFKSEEREMLHVRERRMSMNDDGFHHACHLIDLKHGTKLTEKLEELRPYTKVVNLVAGESLFHHIDGSVNEERERGLFFIEHGIIRVERDPFSKTTRGRGSMRSQNGETRTLMGYGSLSNLNARTASLTSDMCQIKYSSQSYKHNVRIARIGSGWVVGALEGLSQIIDTGFYIAVTPVRLHHLPYNIISELEESNPALTLTLFKMMSLITARRQEATIAQLATLQNIMSSLSHIKQVKK